MNVEVEKEVEVEIDLDLEATKEDIEDPRNIFYFYLLAVPDHLLEEITDREADPTVEKIANPEI